MEEREFCSSHIELITDLTEIKSSVKNIERGITQATPFKTAIVSSLLGMLLVIIIQVITFSYLYGKLVNQVEVNSARIINLEKVLP